MCILRGSIDQHLMRSGAADRPVARASMVAYRSAWTPVLFRPNTRQTYLHTCEFQINEFLGW